MREILFRGKRKDDGEWVEGYFLETNSPEYRCFIVTTCSVDCDLNFIDILDINMYEVIPETVGQYTGLPDKNGKKIFEGDIVKSESSQLLGKVVFAKSCDGYDGIAGFMVDDIYDGLQNYDGFWHLVEIIGNIHDNPKLLEVLE